MEIIAVDNNWKKNVFFIDVNLGSVCNYNCWYCWPGSNSGDVKFPNLELLQKNITHLIRHYEKNSPKRIFSIHFCGGEPSHWPKLIEFVMYLRKNHNCLISMTSNGSKKIDWWKRAAPYFDKINMSCHHQYVDFEKYRDICDYLYSKNVVVSVSVMMDPFYWDRCMQLIKELKKSKNKWTIRYVEIIDDNIKYTEKQKQVLKKHRARKCNMFWFLKNNKYYISKVTAIDINGKKHKLGNDDILLNRMNNFYGWECSVGYNWIAIDKFGNISGTCGVKLYGDENNYNIYNKDFTKIFNPKITPAICTKQSCVCSIETVMPKRKIQCN